MSCPFSPACTSTRAKSPIVVEPRLTPIADEANQTQNSRTLPVVVTDHDICEIRRHAQAMAHIVVEMYEERCKNSE